ncbi:MAG TPA: DUF2059 domain-containing protein [Pseudoxanthomonas sp.]|nr:DUF2059 domain-containing protein [Pseudoxanthomonas sp.]
MPRFLPGVWLTLMACLLLASGAQAAPPSDEDIERLLKASRAQSMLDAIGPQVEAMQQQQFERLVGDDTKLGPQQRADAERIRARSSQIMGQMLSWEKMRPLYIDVYRKTFTSEEAKAISEFYESPPGKAVLDKTPLLMQNLMAAMQKDLMPMLEALETELDAGSGKGGEPAATRAG